MPICAIIITIVHVYLNSYICLSGSMFIRVHIWSLIHNAVIVVCCYYELCFSCPYTGSLFRVCLLFLPYSTVIPLVGVLSVTATKDAYDDIVSKTG